MARLELELDANGVLRGARVAERALDGVTTASQRTETALRRTSTSGVTLGGAVGRMGRAMSGARGQIQNVAFQIGDFATQVGAGTNASVALGQQLPQLVGGFGAVGAVLGAVVAIGVPLAAAFLRGAETAATLEDAIRDLDETLDDVSSALERQSLSVDEIIERYGRYTTAVQDLIDTLTELEARQAIEDAAAAVSALDPGPLARAVFLFDNLGGTSGQAARNASSARRQLEQMEPAIRSAAQRYIELREADSTEEQAELAGELRRELQALDDARFDGLIGSLAQLEDRLRQTAAQAADARAAVAGMSTGTPLFEQDVPRLLPPEQRSEPEPITVSTGGGGGGGGGGVSAADRAAQEAERAADAYDRLRARLDPAIAAQQRYNDAVKVAGDVLLRGQITQEQFNATVALAREEFEEATSGLQGFLSEMDRLEGLQSMDTLVTGAARSLQGALADFLFNPFEEGVRGMVFQFSQALQRMAAEAIAAQIVQSIFGAVGGGGGFNFGGLFRDRGGYLPAGSAAVVAERRPEIVNGQMVSTPSVVRGPADITSGSETERMGGGRGNVNIQNNLVLDIAQLAEAITRNPLFEQRVTEIQVVNGNA